ncbi:MAG: hypothetical protein QOF88_1187 [Mycobacterium sp.]|jgi:hypothetical protein|nr:hypothetical protein [Mycobacterium sp.]
MSRTSRALYALLSVATSVAGGIIAGSVFSQIWKRRPPAGMRTFLPTVTVDS